MKARKRGDSYLLILVLIVTITWVVSAFIFTGCGGSSSATTSVSANSTDGSRAVTTSAGTASGDPVVIGAIVSATGSGAPLGEPERNVLELAEAQINEAGGILGRPLELVILDDESNPKEAVTAANRLLQQEKAVVLLACTLSPSTLAVKPITAKAGIPQISMAAANDITDQSPIDWLWRSAHKDALAVARALKYVSENLQAKKVAVLHDENAFGSSGKDEVERTAGDWGLEVVAVQSYKTNDTDLTAQLTKIRAAGPDALIVWGTNPGPALAAKNMRQLGMDVPYVGSHGISNTKFIELGGEAAEGVVFPAGKLLVPSSVTDPEQKKVCEDLVASYRAAHGTLPNTFAGHAYDALLLAVNAIETAGSTDPEAIQQAMNSTKGFRGPDGIYNFTETDHDGLSVDDMVMVKVEGGKWVLAE